MKIKTVENGYILGIGEGYGTPITEEEYATILQVINEAPEAPEGYRYLLREDLTWELEELPPAPDEIFTEESLAEMTKEELADILTGMGISATMTKANMIRLILAMQNE